MFGTLKGGKDALTGIVDIAMVGSLYKKGKFHEKLNSYGMVIMDDDDIIGLNQKSLKIQASLT